MNKQPPILSPRAASGLPAIRNSSNRRDHLAARSVLIVDDDKSIRTLVAAILSGMGLKVLHASDGGQAILLSRSYESPIDLLLSDIQMDPQLSGIELARQLRLERPNLRILLMSGAFSEADIPTPDCEFIRKPFLPDCLKRRVQRLLNVD